MSAVRIPLEVSTSGEESAKKIKEIISEAKEGVEDIETKISESGTTKESTSDKGSKKSSSSEKEDKTKIDKILENDLGFDKATNIINYGTNPTGAILQQLFKIGALPAALLGGPQIADKIIDILQQEGQFFDRFLNDTIDTRNDALRDKQIQQQILQGFESLRISTIDGNFDPRNVYNSFEVFENDRTLLENDFKIRVSA